MGRLKPSSCDQKIMKLTVEQRIFYPSFWKSSRQTSEKDNYMQHMIGTYPLERKPQWRVHCSSEGGCCGLGSWVRETSEWIMNALSNEYNSHEWVKWSDNGFTMFSKHFRVWTSEDHNNAWSWNSLQLYTWVTKEETAWMPSDGA